MHVRRVFSVGAFFIFLLSISLYDNGLHAQITQKPASRFAIGFNGGTVGAGADITTNITKKLNLRIGYHAFSYSDSGTYDDDEPAIGYSGELSQSNISFLADFYPMNRGLKFTAGVYIQNFEITANASPSESYTIFEGQSNEKEFGPERLGTIDALVTYPNSVMPYFGIGFGNPVAKGSALKLNMSLGLMYSGAPELTMSGSGLIAPTVNQAIDFQEGLNEFEWFPVFKLGLSLRVKK